MKVCFYGKLADLFGNECEVAVDAPCTVADLRQRLASDHPQGADALQHQRVRACIGDEIAQDGDIIPEGRVIEFLAPVSGG